ncbi:MAG: HD domain-containing protein, partial [Acidimicrobiia bacterium]|nr:HD domain-containing protein [Acidimicrobiia bacterium]
MGDTENRWEGRPVRAFVIRAFAFVAPVAAALLVAFWLSKAIPRPGTWGLFALWWLSILVISTIVLRVTEKFARKLLPLAALLKLTLVFPDRAPTRFTMSMRTGGAETLEEMVAEAEAAGAKDDFASAAETILALAARLNSHDPRTRGHAERVRAYADMIAEEMGFDDEDRNKVKWACMLHDIGKLKVPLEIINKPGRLTDDEYEVIKNHPTWGMELAAPLLPWLGDFASGIGQHHERFDGFGYPGGVEGTDIGLAGRIAAVADTFDVITSVRSYKQARPASEAREELARCAGSQFDPEVVRAFLNIGLGRQRWVAGPLSWLGQVPMVQSVVQGLTTAASNAGAVVSTATAATAIGAASIVAPTLFPSAPVAELPPSPEVVAVDDTALVDEDGSVTLEIMANDVGTIVAVNIIVPPLNGTARVVDNQLVYTPDPEYSGTDTIRYEVCDASGNCDEAVATVTVNPVNDLPVVVTSSVDGIEDETLLI